jgi:hypothetical protein
MSSIVSSEGQDSAPQVTTQARLPSIFAEEVGELFNSAQPFYDPLHDEIDQIVPGGGRRRSATATLAPSRISGITGGSTGAVALPRAVLRAMESLHDAIVKEMDAAEPPEQDEAEGAELLVPGIDAHLRLRHARTKC